MKQSIKRQLLTWLLVPLLSLALLSTLVAYFVATNLAREIYDRTLLNSADSVMARIIRSKSGGIAVDIPTAAASILKQNYKDEFYYQVISSEGKLLGGDKFLPAPPVEQLATKEFYFQTIEMKGKQLRMVTLKLPSPDAPDKIMWVQAAETRNARKELTSLIAMSILFVQLILIASAFVAVWLGVERGLLPLRRVRAAVESRAPGDLSPLAVEEPTELVSLIAALNRLFRQIGEDIESQQRFISNAAHQLRTPLAVLGTYVDLSRKLVSDKEAQEVLKELEGSVQRMAKLVNRLLSLARSEPNAALSRPRDLVDLNEVASTAAAACAPEAVRKKVSLEYSPSSMPALVFGDRTELEELTNNLIENSILYTQPGGFVKVSVEKNEDAVLLSVEDNGPGIPVAERSRVFERFYRISGTEAPGTGLGLSIVKEIVSSHRAGIKLESGAHGEGLKVEISFPSKISDLNNSGRRSQQRELGLETRSEKAK